MGQSCVNTARWRTVKEMEVGKFNNQEHLHKHETEKWRTRVTGSFETKGFEEQRKIISLRYLTKP